MKKNLQTSYILILSIFIIVIFISTLYINLTNNNSDSFYGKTETELTGIIKTIELNDNYINIVTRNDAKELCIKSTKSKPNDNNLCWKKVKNNNENIPILKNKKYYIWVKDQENKISKEIIINS